MSTDIFSDKVRPGAAIDAAADADRPARWEKELRRRVAYSERRKKVEAHYDQAREWDAAATPDSLIGRGAIVASCLGFCLLSGVAWWGCALLLERAF